MELFFYLIHFKFLQMSSLVEWLTNQTSRLPPFSSHPPSTPLHLTLLSIHAVFDPMQWKVIAARKQHLMITSSQSAEEREVTGR